MIMLCAEGTRYDIVLGKTKCQSILLFYGRITLPTIGIGNVSRHKFLLGKRKKTTYEGNRRVGKVHLIENNPTIIPFSSILELEICVGVGRVVV